MPPNALGRLNRIAGQRLELAIEEVDALGTFAEEYSIVYARYPSGSGISGTIVETLQECLGDTVPQVLPNIDPWGTPYTYWSDGAVYYILSSGPDRSRQVDLSTYEKTPDLVSWREYCPRGDDIVFINGNVCN